MRVLALVHPLLVMRGQFLSQPFEKKREWLAENGIGAVVNVTTKVDPELVDGGVVDYYHGPFTDGDRVPDEAVRRAAAFAVERMREGKRVLVHCKAGRNRSGLVAALALREFLGITSQQAIDMIRAERPRALTNETFVGWLLQLDKE